MLGNCGWSPAPLSATNREHRAQWQNVASALGPHLTWDWTTFAEYLDHLDRVGAAVNTVALVGHSAIRSAVFGIEDRRPTAPEMAEMIGLLAEALTAGAWGMSTGLVYPPSSFAGAAEVEALAAELSSRNALYSTHMRDEGPKLAAAIEEAIDVGRHTGARVQISHLKASSPASHGRIGEALAMIDQARAEGVAVGCDAYPYSAGSTVLTQLLPSWAMEGGVTELLSRLRSTEMRERMRSEIHGSPSGFLNKLGGWTQVMISGVGNPSFGRFDGRFLPEIAASEGKSEADLLFDLLIKDDARTTMVIFAMDDNDVEQVLDHKSTVIGSDQLGVHSPTSRVHPRAYGTFARVMARSAARGEASLATAVAQATSLSAARLGLNDRGLIRPGYTADIVLFDPQAIADTATYEDPAQLAVGIEAVFLSGSAAVVDGAVLDSSLGRVLRPGATGRAPSPQS